MKTNFKLLMNNNSKMKKSKRQLLNKDKEFSNILDFCVDILFHIKTIKNDNIIYNCNN